jgi:hypothetical protein
MLASRGNTIVDQATTAWETMLAEANRTVPADTRLSTLRGPAFVALRMTVLLILAALAILVLLPAALVAQSAFSG